MENSVFNFNVKALVGTFYQEKALVALFRDCENFADGSFAALVICLQCSPVTSCCPAVNILHCFSRYFVLPFKSN